MDKTNWHRQTNKQTTCKLGTPETSLSGLRTLNARRAFASKPSNWGFELLLRQNFVKISIIPTWDRTTLIGFADHYLHCGQEDVDETDHNDGEVEKIPRILEREICIFGNSPFSRIIFISTKENLPPSDKLLHAATAPWQWLQKSTQQWISP